MGRRRSDWSTTPATWFEGIFSFARTLSTVAASFSRGDGASDSGKWWVADDQLCQQWSSWMDGKTYCYKLTRNGSTVQWVRNDGRSGTARISG